jgi:hypothetical protein
MANRIVTNTMPCDVAVLTDECIEKCTKLVRTWVGIGSIWGFVGGSGGQEVYFLMGYKNFEVPGAVDSEMSRNISKVIRS